MGIEIGITILKYVGGLAILLMIIIIGIQTSEIKSLKKESNSIQRTNEDQNNRIQKLVEEKDLQSEDILKKKEEIEELEKKLSLKYEFINVAGSNLTAIPYMAKLVADYETIGLENLAASLDWGYNAQREKKVKSIREIREDARLIVEKSKYAQYQLAYLLELYPGLQDVIDTDYSDLPSANLELLAERDPVRDYLTADEYNSLTTAEKNQLALDRYVNSHNKSKWQIGRDYELFIGHQYLRKGCVVNFFGSNMGLEDLGRDLIVHKPDGKILIIQCKYWGKEKLIHEKHITQLYGTTVSYCIENNIPQDSVKGILITNVKLSDIAKKMAKYLNIEYKENIDLGDYPRIKCNNGKDELGYSTKIYHLPFDQQYDNIKMIHKDDFWAYTVEEAEQAGYRRAGRWFGN